MRVSLVCVGFGCWLWWCCVFVVGVLFCLFLLFVVVCGCLVGVFVCWWFLVFVCVVFCGWWVVFFVFVFCLLVFVVCVVGFFCGGCLCLCVCWGGVFLVGGLVRCFGVLVGLVVVLLVCCVVFCGWVFWVVFLLCCFVLLCCWVVLNINFLQISIISFL